jgi:hypothetical protein
VLLSAGTIYWLFVLSAFGQWLYGAYVGVLAALIYGCAALILLFSDLRAVILRRREASAVALKAGGA